MSLALNKTRTYRFFAGLLCLLILVFAMPQKAFAAGLINPQKSVSLTIRYRHENPPVPGVTFRIYRVADVSPSAEFTLSGAFKDYPVSLENTDSAALKALAATLAGYTARDGITPDDSGITNESGRCRFPANQTNMTTGLYLVIGERHTEGEYTYTPEPLILCLPSQIPKPESFETDLEYHVIIEPKYDNVYHPPGGEKQFIDLKALKVWEGAGNEAHRPETITVQLLRDGSIFDTEILNADNNWRHTWTSLDADFLWQVVEQQVPDGYTVSVGREGITSVITNTFHPDQPEKPVNPPDKKPPKLPQTGMLWWPVPVLSGVGIVVFMIGWSRRRKKSETENE